MKQHLPKLREHGPRFALFGLVGVFNTLSDFAVYTAAVLLGLAPVLSNLVAFAVANPCSYFINSRVTFRRQARPAPVSFRGYGKFLAAHLFSLSISTGMVFFFAPVIGPILAKGSAVVVTIFINYAASALMVFPHKESAKRTNPESP